jgi:Protein of unknown function (DUF998)
MSLATVAATYSLVAIALAVALVVLLHVLEPEYDPSWRMLSEYSLGRYGPLMRFAFIAAGTGVMATAVALSGPAWPWSIGLVVVAVGPLVAAFVDTDPITTPRAAMSRRSNVHAAFGSLFILGFPLVATATGIGAIASPSVGPILALASVGPWIALAWFIWTSARHARPDVVGGPDIPIGWPNRASMIVYLGWLGLAAAMMLA